jgi:hypothetical protein
LPLQNASFRHVEYMTFHHLKPTGTGRGISWSHDHAEGCPSQRQ